MKSRGQEAFDAFAGFGVFETPVPAGFTLKLQWLRQGLSGQRCRQEKPDEAGGTGAVTGKTMMRLGKLDEPAIGSDLGRDERNGSLIESDEMTVVAVAGKDQVAGDLGQAAPRAPEGLAGLDGQIRAGGEQALRRRATGKERKAGQQQGCRKMVAN